MKTAKVTNRELRRAIQLVEDHFLRTVEQTRTTKRERTLTTRGFVSGLCAMAQLNHMNLSREDAACVFDSLKPLFEKLLK